MVLSDKEILEHLLRKDCLVISPITNGFRQIGSSSVDVRLGSTFKYLKIVKQTHFDIQDLDNLKKQIDEYSEEIVLQPLEPFILHPRDFVLGSTLEYLKLPSCLTARLEGRSSWGRVGLQIHSTAGLIDPGFEGSLTFELHNLGKLPLPLFPGTRIGQLVFYSINDTMELYKDKAGSKFHSQLGPKNSTFYDDYDYKNIIKARNMVTLSKDQIQQICSPQFNEDYWFFELGKADAMNLTNTPYESEILRSFYDHGVKIWEENKEKLRDFLCNKDEGRPKEIYSQLTDSDLTSLVEAVYLYLTDTHSLAGVFAIPICGLFLKKGIINICL